MNVNSEDTKPVTNLRLSLGLSNQFRQRRLNNDSKGAGANAAAASMVEMALVASGSISELVWSSHKGLCLKYAGPSLNPKISSFFEKESIDTPVEMRETSMLDGSLNIQNQVGEPSHRLNAGNYCNLEEIEASVLDVNDKQREKMDCLDQTGGTRDVGSGDQNPDMENDLVSGTNATKQCKASDTTVAGPKSPGGNFPDHHFLQENNILISLSPTQSRIRRYQRKGKEKALSGGSLNTKKSQEEEEEDDDDDSHESVESCNSTGLLSKGKKRRELDQNLCNEDKRSKHNQDSPGSTSFVQQESSFVSWISNMMKAFPKSNQDTTPLAFTLARSGHGQATHEKKFLTCNKDQEAKSRNTGFQNIFKSLYCPDTKAQGETSILNEVCDVNATPLACHGASNVFNERFLVENEKYDPSTHKNGGDPCAKTNEGKVLCKLESNANKNGASPACSSLDKHKAGSDNNNDYNHKNDPLGSLWITRFCHKASIPSQSTAPHSLAQIDTSKERKVETTIKSGASLQNVTSGDKTEASFRGVNTNKLQSSEAMASIFARRLNALKNILPSDTTRLMTCFFCGIKGHALKDCVRVSESELEDLIKNVHSYNVADESPCLCIKCLQPNHWAVSCPNLSSKRKRSEECSNLKLLEKESRSKVGDGQLSDVPKGLFDAMKRLRLSRKNILKWMNSQVPLSHLHGFYLRLRLGKWEEGLGGTGYYVGCINGSPEEILAEGSKGCIPVNIGGMKCLVESQYVSNHDFLEDELAAWWSDTTKSGRNFPTESGIRQKVEDRKKLGL